MAQPIQFAGETITLAASAARTASANGTTIHTGGRAKYIFVLSISDASVTDAGDTLDVYVDFSPDAGTTWINAIHFTQRAGNAAGAKTEVAVLEAGGTGATIVDATTDAASAAVRPYVFGNAMRARWAIVDSGDHNSSHTFGLQAFAI